MNGKFPLKVMASLMAGLTGAAAFPQAGQYAAELGRALANETGVVLPEGKMPNVVLINVDDLGYGDIEPYGSTLHNTPALNKIADEGVKFTHFYTASPVCSPSRSSLMTGCYHPRVGLARDTMWGQVNDFGVLRPGDNIGLSAYEVTMPELLKQRDYATTCIGKWHLGDQPEFLPTRHGFDSYFGLPYSNDLNEGGTVPIPLMENERVVEWAPNQSRLTARYTERALDFIEQNKDRPFFLYLAHTYVHVPLTSNQQDINASKSKTPFGAEIEMVDKSTADILAKLEELGLDGDTMVIFTSDNGGTGKNGSTNAPLRGAKATTWEGGVRVPFMVRWKGKIQPNTVCDETATNMDIMPTLAYLTGQQMPADRITDGKNIWPLMSQTDAVTPYDALYYYRRYDLEAVRKGDWKLHLAPSAKSGYLYNLRSDPGETQNVAAANSGVVNELKAVAAAARQDLGDERLNIPGAGRRDPGRATGARYLTERFDELLNPVVCHEPFTLRDVGSVPPGWTEFPSGTGSVKIAEGTTGQGKCLLLDSPGPGGQNEAKILRVFDALTDKIIIRFDFKTTMPSGSGNHFISVYGESGQEVARVNFSFEWVIKLFNPGEEAEGTVSYTNGVSYPVKLVLDLFADTYSLYIDGEFQKTAALMSPADSVERVEFRTFAANAKCEVDNFNVSGRKVKGFLDETFTEREITAEAILFKKPDAQVVLASYDAEGRLNDIRVSTGLGGTDEVVRVTHPKVKPKSGDYMRLFVWDGSLAPVYGAYDAIVKE